LSLFGWYMVFLCGVFFSLLESHPLPFFLFFFLCFSWAFLFFSHLLLGLIHVTLVGFPFWGSLSLPFFFVRFFFFLVSFPPSHLPLTLSTPPRTRVGSQVLEGLLRRGFLLFLF
jgi:hypothetical protein